MKIAELLEAVKTSLRVPSDAPVTIAYTNRFLRDFKSFVPMPGFVDEFKQFLDAKVQDPDMPFGKKDTQWGGGAVKGIKGWWHAHLVFAKAIVIYKTVGRQLIFAAVTDHKSVEGIGSKIVTLGEYLSKIDTDPNLSPYERADKTNKLTTTSVDALKTSLQIGSSDTEEPIEPVKKQLEEFLYTMAANPKDRQVLQDYHDGKNDELKFFIELIDPPISDTDLKRIDLRTLVGTVLSRLPRIH